MEAKTRARISILSIVLFFFLAVIFAPYSPFRLPGLKLLAAIGIPKYQELLGEMYLWGGGINENYSHYRLYGAHIDYANAYYWLHLAAEAGDPRALSQFGNLYSFGRFVPQSYDEAVKWYRKSAEKGNNSGEYNLGVSYENGQGVPKSYVEAEKWYRKAAIQGHPLAQLQLGNLYENGWGVKQDYAEAFKWFQKAADLGDVDAQSHLGYLYSHGYGVKQSDIEAAKWDRQAAEQGDDMAQFNLGILYEDGDGVRQDYAQAAKWYQKAAEQGVSEAQFNLGNLYYNGHGVPKDFSKARQWYQYAAALGLSEASYNVAVMYDLGQGIQKDYQQCIKWVQPVADKGDGDAKELYGTCKRCVLQHGVLAGSNAHNITSEELETPTLLRDLETYVDAHEDPHSLLISNFHLDLARFYIHSDNEQKAREHLAKITISDYADQLLQPYVGMVLEAFSNRDDHKIFSIVNEYKEIYNNIHRVHIVEGKHGAHVPDEKYVAQNLCGFAGITYARNKQYSRLDKLSRLPQCGGQVLQYELAELLADHDFKAAYLLTVSDPDINKAVAGNPDSWRWSTVGKTLKACIKDVTPDSNSAKDNAFFLNEENKVTVASDEVKKLVLADFLHVFGDDEALYKIGESLSDPKDREAVLTQVYENYYLKGDRPNTLLLASALDLANAPHPAETRMREGGWPQMQWYSYPIRYADILVKHPSTLGCELAMTIKADRPRFKALDAIYWASKDDPNITFPNCNQPVARCVENELLQIAGKEKDDYSRDIMYEDIVDIENHEKDFVVAERTFNKIINHRRMTCGGSICTDNRNNPTTYAAPVADAGCAKHANNALDTLSGRAFIEAVQCSYESGSYKEYLKNPEILGAIQDQYFSELATVLRQHEMYSDELLSVIGKIKNEDLRSSVFHQVIFSFYSLTSAGDKKVVARMNNFVDALIDSTHFQRDDDVWSDTIEMLERRYWSNFASRNEMSPKDENEWSDLIWGNVEKLLSKRPDLEECGCENVFNLADEQCPIMRLVIGKKYDAALSTPTELDRALAKDAILHERFLHDNENYRNSINRGWQYFYIPTSDLECSIHLSGSERKN